MISFLKANSLYTVKPSLAETTANVRIVAGGRETKNIRDSVKLLHSAIPGSCAEILPGLRHGDLSLNYPEKYAELISRWLESS
jgi:hypothetical protein